MPHGPRSAECEVAVIGAGPYGLALAAHLKGAGVETRVFGDPMSFWRDNMPKGMLLRSPRRATSISDPDEALTLDVHAGGRAPSFGDRLPLENFVDYGLWFQGRVAPDLDRRPVSRVAAAPGGFVLTLSEGPAIVTKRVAVATGLQHQQFVPEIFKGLPIELASHTSAHSDLATFRGKRVAVVGRGQSAVESAVLLSEAGAEVELISRGPIQWLGGATEKSMWRSARGRLGEALAAPSAVGPFPFNWIVEIPGFVHLAPHDLRAAFNRRCLRAAAAGWLRPRFPGVRENPCREIGAAAARGDRISLRLDDGEAVFDHALPATGYAIDVAKLGLLSPDLLAAVDRRSGSPILSAGFEASVAGLHFIGASSVASYGPLMRFIAGAGFAARHVTEAVRRARATSPRPLRPRQETAPLANDSKPAL
jgi:cation diffusion facilitator CzcD-associated flavoprotein CzcO